MKKFIISLLLVVPGLLVSAQRHIDAHWCALGTSITWYNDNVSAYKPGCPSPYTPGIFTAGYQTRVGKKLAFNKVTNGGANGGNVERVLPFVVKADYYTIEHGINDWGYKIKPGTFEDYLNNTNNGTFAASYRKVIDKIFSLNPAAKVVLCTPRKGHVGGSFTHLPDAWYKPNGDCYLEDYAKIVRQIAEYEGFPVADFFGQCAGQRLLMKHSINDALHPNDKGYQIMANILIDALEKVITE